VGLNVISVTVTAENGVATKTYVVNVTRQAGGGLSPTPPTSGVSGGSATTEITEAPAPLASTPSAVSPTARLGEDDGKAYIKGYPDGTFHPESDVTRAETASMLYGLITNEDKASYESEATKYSDVEKDAWYAKAVGFLSASKAIQGYPDGSFGGAKAITRAEFATLMTRLAASSANGDAPFSDITGHWAHDGILSSYAAKWITGYPDGTFRPDQNITRAEAVAVINRVIGRDKSAYQNHVMPFSDVPPGAWYYGDVLAASIDRT
jgi:hypothetical protein